MYDEWNKIFNYRKRKIVITETDFDSWHIYMRKIITRINFPDLVYTLNKTFGDSADEYIVGDMSHDTNHIFLYVFDTSCGSIESDYTGYALTIERDSCPNLISRISSLKNN